MISKASSFSSPEALEKKIIDGIANSEQELWQKLDGASLNIKGQSFTVKMALRQVITYTMDWGQCLMDIFANPNMAYILFIIGAALIYLEFQHPGGFIAGSLGALCLILAGIAFQVLPLNFGALGLIVLAFILFLLEIYVTSYGILAISGMISLIIGSLFLFRTQDSYMDVSTAMILSSAGAIGSFLIFLTFFLYRDIRRKKKRDFYTLVGKTAIIAEVLPTTPVHAHNFLVRLSGETWKAFSQTPLAQGEECLVIDQKNESMTLTVEPIYKIKL